VGQGLGEPRGLVVEVEAMEGRGSSLFPRLLR
jgi:hypothetical protein